MLCDNCKKRPASMHITKIHNNHKVEKHLCQQCAGQNEEGGLFSWDSNLSVHDLLKGMFSHEYTKAAELAEITCENCGMSYHDFSRSGKIGCGVCYNKFGSRLEPVIRRMHGAAYHTGKVPARGGAAIGIRARILKLRHELERYVSREEYEEAARMRDEIRLLEQQLQEMGGDVS